MPTAIEVPNEIYARLAELAEKPDDPRMSMCGKPCSST